jgi:polar amino acid transport system substrate-binding protein
MTRLHRTKALVALLAVFAALLAACGSDSEDKDILTPAAPDLPKAIQDRGTLRVGSDIAYPPIEFYKEGTEEVQGFDYDLGKALAEEFDLEVEFINIGFDGIIGALNAGRFDIVMSAMTDTKERQAEVDFVDYFTAGGAILVQKGNPKNIKTVDDLCGNSVAVQQGTTYDLALLTPQVDKCATAGKPLNVLRFEKDTDALQQVKLGRAVANLSDSPVAAYAAKTSGGGEDFEVAGESLDPAPYGIAIPKNSPLLQLIQTALKKLIQNGDYDHILEKWNLRDGALRTATINGGS